MDPTDFISAQMDANPNPNPAKPAGESVDDLLLSSPQKDEIGNSMNNLPAQPLVTPVADATPTVVPPVDAPKPVDPVVPPVVDTTAEQDLDSLLNELDEKPDDTKKTDTKPDSTQKPVENSKELISMIKRLRDDYADIDIQHRKAQREIDVLSKDVNDYRSKIREKDEQIASFAREKQDFEQKAVQATVPELIKDFVDYYKTYEKFQNPYNAQSTVAQALKIVEKISGIKGDQYFADRLSGGGNLNTEPGSWTSPNQPNKAPSKQLFDPMLF